MARGSAILAIVIALTACSRDPEPDRTNGIVVLTGPETAATKPRPPQTPTVVPTPMATTAAPSIERQPFVDSPLPPELIDPPGLEPLPQSPRR